MTTFSADRFKSAVAAVVNQLIPNRRFLAPAEYEIVTAGDGKFSASPKSKDYPMISNAPIRGMVAANAGSKLAPGDSVLVAWIEGDRARPYLQDVLDSPTTLAVEAKAKASITAPQVEINGPGQPIARAGDTVAGIFVITSGSFTARCG